MASEWFIETEQQAHATLGNSVISHNFRFNPDSIDWSYEEVIQPYDTIGGRVLQVLSGKVNNLTINGRAGSRGELQRLAKNCASIMAYQIKTQEPVFFKVPTKNWNFLVYLQAVPQLGWSVAATSYPYQIVLNIVDDLTGLSTQEMRGYTLDRLATGIGYNPDVHGGDAPAFSDLVNNLQLGFTAGEDGTGGTGDGTGGTGGTGGGGTGEVVDLPSGFVYGIETKFYGTLNFSRHTGTIPDWVKQRPNLFTWNGTTLQQDAMISFQALCKKVGKVTTTTGYRTYAEQERLYKLYLSGEGNKAAKPGTSYHELGIAIDMEKIWYSKSVVTNTFTSNNWFRVVDGELWHFSYKVAG